MNIRHRLQQLDKRNIQKICSQMGIKSSGNKSQLITRLLLPLQTYKANIHYSKSISYTINGTIGIKIWTFENY